MDSFFGIGLAELFFIAVIALLVLGPERLPGTLREIAKMWGYVRNLGRELTSQFSEEFKALEDLDPRKLLNEMADEELKKDLKTLTKKPGAVSTKPTTPKATTPKPATPKPATTTAKPASTKTTTTTSSAGKTTAKRVAKPAEQPSDVQPTTEPTAEEASAATSQSAADNTENTILPPLPEAMPAAASEPLTGAGSEEPSAEGAALSSPEPVRVNGANANGAAESGENAG